MANEQEIDLEGLSIQIDKVSKEIGKLTSNLSEAEKVVLNVSNTDISNKLKIANTNLKSVGDSVNKMFDTLKNGKTGMTEFINYLDSLKSATDSLKGMGQMPVTGFVESLNKLQGGYKALKNYFEDIAFLGEKNSKTEQERQEWLQAANSRERKWMEERKKRNQENLQDSIRHNKELQRQELIRESYISGQSKILKYEELQIKALERKLTYQRESALRAKENAEWARAHSTGDDDLKRQELINKSYEDAQAKIARYENFKLKAVQRQSVLQNEAALRAKENAEWAEKHNVALNQQQKVQSKNLSLGQALAKMQKKMMDEVLRGNSAAIQKYLQYGVTVERLNTVLKGLQNAQQKCNLATKEGQQRYAELGNQINYVNSLLGNSTSLAQKLNGLFGKTKNVVSQVAMSFGVMTGVFGATSFVKNLYRITSEFQLQQRALSAIVQNTREATRLFKQMQQLSVESPMKLMDLNKYAKQLAAFRIETTQLFDSLKMLGDISVGVGVDMDRLILAYGQVKAANYLRGQELRQFSEAGVNILGGLQEYYRETKNINMSINEIFDSVSKRKVLFEDVDAVLHRMTESGGEFYNMQLIQSQTLYGQTQKLADLFQISMNNIGKSTSGILMGFVQIVQFLIRNLRTVLSIVVAMTSAKYLTKLVMSFRNTWIQSQKLVGSLRTAMVAARRLGKTSMTGLVAGLGKAGFAANALSIAIQAAAAAIAFFFAKRAENKQKEADIQQTLTDEITEYNRRLYEVRELEKDYAKDPTFKGRLALFEQLIEKAKEYRLALDVDENITSANINENFERASNQLEAYTKKVLLFKSALYTADVNEALEGLNKVNVAFADATLAANRMINNLSNVYDSLSENQRKALNEIKDIDDAFLKNDKEFLKNIDYTYDEWQIERIKKIQALTTIMPKGISFVGSEAVKGLNEAQEKEMVNIISSLNNFSKKYEKEFKNTAEKLGEEVSKIVSPGDFIGLNEEQVIEKIKEIVPPILDSLGEAGDFAKQNLPDLLQYIFGLKEGKAVSIAKIVLEMEEATTDVGDKEWKKRVNELIKEGKIQSEIEVKVRSKEQINTNQPGFEWMELYNEEMENFEDELKEQWSDIIKTQKVSVQEFVNPNEYETPDAFKKALDDKIKYLDEFLETYKDAAVDFKFINSWFGTDFASSEDAKKAIQEMRKALQEEREILFGKTKSTTSGRGQSMKSEYQSMIDFVKKLNTEFDKLRKNFDEDDKGGWAGAFKRIVDSYSGEFSEMPKQFRDAFNNSIENIDFTTKEGAKKGEEIVKGIIDGAKNISKEEKAELKRTVERTIGDISVEIELELKSREDERLKSKVQDMIDDFNLTDELEKMDVNVAEVAGMFNITKRSLSELQEGLMSMKDEFIGQDMEKEYREFWRKIQDISDKQNLELSKKYAKYLRQAYGQRAQLELEYMRQRAEVYALPFDELQESQVLGNLQKEFEEKMSKIEWDEFRSNDFYIEMFEDLEHTSTSAINIMVEDLENLKGSLKGLQPTELKAITEQITKLQEELIRRNPFEMLLDSIKEWKSFKEDENTSTLIDKYIGMGTEDDKKLRSFKNRLDRAYEIAEDKVGKAKKDLNLYDALLGAAKAKEDALIELKLSPTISKDDVKKQLDSLEDEVKDWVDRISQYSPKEIAEDDALQRESQYTQELKERLEAYTKLYSSMETLAKYGQSNTQVEALEYLWKNADEEMKKYIEDFMKLQGGEKVLSATQKAVKRIAEDGAKSLGELKTAFNSVWEYADALGAESDVLTEAWKEFGNTLFDTITGALEMIPSLITGFTAAGVAINSAMGIIGLIAEVIQLVITLLTSIAKLHDAAIEKDIQKIQKNVDKLNKSAEALQDTFDNLFNTDKLREYDAAIIKTKELAIDNLNDMIAAEREKKDKDQDRIDDWQNQIEEAQQDIVEQTEAFFESMGGVGGASGMKSIAEEWTDAWYTAFKETGDGLSGLEDSFESFLDNLFKKQIMNTLFESYFSSLFDDLNEMLAKEGGLQGNMMQFNQWVDAIQNAMYGFNEDAAALANQFMQIGGIGGGLEGLTQSIQGMTEDTANIVAAYLNSLRYYVSENNDRIEYLTAALTTDNDANPIIYQLKVIAQQTTAINILLDSVVASTDYQSANGPVGGSYIKVKLG